MNRSIEKAIEEYKKLFCGDNCKRGQFFVSDYMQIKELSKGDYWQSVSNATMAGFMIGYRTAKRHCAEPKK